KEKPQVSQFTLEQFLLEQEQRDHALTSVEGKLRVRYAVKQGSFAGAAKLIKYEHQSRFEVSDPMGRVRYWIIGDPKNILAFYESDKTAYLSSEGGKNYFRRFYGMALDWEELLSLWMGILPASWRKNVGDSWDYSEGSYKGVVRDRTNHSVSFEVSEEKRQLIRLVFKQDKNEIQVSLNDFDACCAQGKKESILGHGVEIKLPKSSEKIELEWEELNILEQIPNPLVFSKKLPGGIKLVNLEKEQKHE
ncbi:hypothetical protein EBT16_13555, partial [bacterium]|nr:hypothetical protein [bacterium]